MRHLLTVLISLHFVALATGEMADIIRSYAADVELFQRHWSLSDDSNLALEREQKLLEGSLKDLRQVPFDGFKQRQKVDYILMRNDLDAMLHRVSRKRQRRAELAPWLPFRGAVESLTDARVKGEVLDPKAVAGVLAPLAESIQALQAKLKKAHEKKPGAPEADAVKLPTAYQAARLADETEEMAESLKRWFGNFEGFLPDFYWWAKQPYDDTAKALEGYAKFAREELAGVKSKDDGPLIGKSEGEEELRLQLAREFIPYSPQEVITIGEREFAWCEAELRRAAKEMGLGDDWKPALAKVKQMHVPPGEQEAVVREEGLRAAKFVKDKQLVTVPARCEEWWGTRMLSAQEQKQIPYAAYSGHDMLVAYASAGMKHADKIMSMRGNNRPFMRNVVPHELIPGHHLQSFMAARHLPYRRDFSTPFFVEGWALYWEMRLYDLGYHSRPEDRIGALFWRLNRCARIIVSMKFHLGQMKPDEMVKFMVDRVGHERFGATSEVRRFISGNYQPLYQAAYMVGGQQLLALHKECVASGKMTERGFHDSILRLGPIPVELLRASLLDLPLAREYSAQWRFAELPLGAPEEPPAAPAKAPAAKAELPAAPAEPQPKR